ncbi:hypothetical protein S7711_10120 [Stachybotrys chartarum IBT 7711]|uniref:GH64 domain-containing protein n=1 Tax=Stachybotrys chartarum (strain CBS 109288 / IBT 7711) TaxID=1280523 RepID=A0A084BAC5_STACB|nr:hypothetical protein S7711_10120 [Stachybotrys chartarum IBT 7711]
MALSTLLDLVQINNNSNFTIAHPGSVNDVLFKEGNMLKGSYLSASETLGRKERQIPAHLPLEFTNNFNGGQVNAYLTGLDSNNAIIFLAANGTLIYPNSRGSETPVLVSEDIAIPLTPKGDSLRLALPTVINSARIYFCEGELNFFMVRTSAGESLVQPSPSNLHDPSSGSNWGFIELTYTNDLVLYANLSFVDFVGMVLGMQLTVTDGGPTQTAYGLPASAVADICKDLITQSYLDGYPWSRLCITNELGEFLRVLSPNEYTVIRPADFKDYWHQYVDQVWQHYSATFLTIDTQTEAGHVDCQVSGDLLYCNGGDNRGYAKPSARDIWGCDSGPFDTTDDDNFIHLAVIPRLCSAFVRSTLLLEGGDIQPSLDSLHYYGANPTHHYSRVVHKYEVDGKGYAYAYDDVNPHGEEDASGVVSSGAADTLTIFVGATPDTLRPATT